MNFDEECREVESASDGLTVFWRIFELFELEGMEPGEIIRANNLTINMPLNQSYDLIW